MRRPGKRSAAVGLSALVGPATVVSVAYIDPGNFGSNIAAGSKHGLDLLWIVWLSGGLAILFQYLSGKIGAATSLSLADHVKEILRRGGRAGRAAFEAYAGGVVLMILATDMAEFLGIALGLHLLLGIPLIYAVWLSVVDVLVLLTLVGERRKALESLIGGLVGVVGFSLLYELFIVGASLPEILRSSVEVRISSGDQILLAASILGATVMPHAVMIHSYLTADIAREGRAGGRDLLRRHLRETVAYLAVASVVNAALQIMAYYAFYRNGHTDVDIDMAYALLEPLYGAAASTAFGIAMLASGISSSMVSVMAGQRFVETWIGRRLEAWKLRLGVRLANMVPLALALHAGARPVDVLVYSQVVLSMILPAVVIPTTILSSRTDLMGPAANGAASKILSAAGSLFITGLNIWLVALLLGFGL